MSKHTPGPIGESSRYNVSRQPAERLVNCGIAVPFAARLNAGSKKPTPTVSPLLQTTAAERDRLKALNSDLLEAAKVALSRTQPHTLNSAGIVCRMPSQLKLGGHHQTPSARPKENTMSKHTPGVSGE